MRNYRAGQASLHRPCGLHLVSQFFCGQKDIGRVVFEAHYRGARDAKGENAETFQRTLSYPGQLRGKVPWNTS